MSGKNVAALVMVALAVLVSLIWLMSGGGMMGWGTSSGMMGWWSGYGFPGLGSVMLFVGALVIGGLVWMGASLVRASRPAAVPVAGTDGPLGILKERYARGEITREAYDQMRRELER